MNGAVRVLRVAGTALLLPVVLVSGWWLLSRNSTSFYNPPLSSIIGVFPDTWFSHPLSDSRLAQDVLPSVGRLLAGLGLAEVVGVGLGVVIGLSRTVRACTEPVLEFFRAIPPPILVPVLMLFLGIGTTMKIVVIATGCLWPILLNTVEGVRSIDPVLRDTARSYRLGRGALVRTLVLRSASPQIATGTRQALSIGLILMVISEMFAANSGLGYSIVQFQTSFAIPEMWSGVLLLGCIGVLLSLAFQAVSGRALRWYVGSKRSQQGGQ